MPDELTWEQKATIAKNKKDALERKRLREERVKSKTFPPIKNDIPHFNDAKRTRAPDLPQKNKSEAVKKSQMIKYINVALDCEDKFIIDAHDQLTLLYRKHNGRFSKKSWLIPIFNYQSIVTLIKKEHPFIRIKQGIPKNIIPLFMNPPRLPPKIMPQSPATLLDSLYPFQRESLDLALQWNGRALLADEMGLGKSIQALAIATHYKLEWPLLIVSPASMIGTWQLQCERWCSPNVNVNCIWDGKHDVSSMGIGRGSINDVWIVSYELCTKIVAEKRFNVVIADESHALKNKDSKRSRVIIPLLQKAARSILLSGTPALSRPLELYTQISAVRPDLFPKFWEYGIRYCAGRETNFGWDFKGSSNMKELSLILSKTIMIRRSKQEVLTQLPPKHRHAINLHLCSKDLKIMESLMKLHQIPEEIDDKVLEEQSGFTGYMALWKKTAEIKMKAMKEYIDDLVDAREDSKFLIFAHHQSILDEWESHFLTKRMSFIRIDGKVAANKRTDHCDTFQTNPSVRIALLSITAASTGITLTAASTVIFTELYWNPGIMLQAEDRAHRIGQPCNVNIHYLLAKGTSDDRIWPMILRKLRLLEKVGLGKSDFDTMSRRDQDQSTLDPFISHRR